MEKMNWSKYNIIYESPKHGYLLFNLLSGAFIDLNDNELRDLIFLLKDGNIESLLEEHADIKSFLLSSAIINNNGDEQNINFLKMRALMRRYDNSHKALTILPTLNCNLKCSYCFVGDNIVNKSMSREVINQLKNYLKNSYSKVEQLSLCWFGGEPLLELPIIEEITEYIKELGIKYKSDIVTNGILITSDVINLLEKLNISNIQITLDGIKETHDRKRIFENGQGTFDRIMNNLRLLHDSIEKGAKKSVNIRINVDMANKDEYHKMRSFIKANFPKFLVYPGIIMKYSSCSSAVNCFSSQKEIAEFWIEQYEKYGIDDISFYPFLRGINACTADNPYSEIIGPEGEIYLCLKDVGDKKESIGSIMNSGRNIELLTNYTVKYFAYDVDECKKCRVLALCGGGCSNLRYRKDKYGEEHDYCAQFKNNISFNICNFSGR